MILLSIYSCCREKDLKYSLNAAGKNRIELEKVLEHYKDSGPKYDAACFLINLKSASNLNGNLNCSKELEHYAS